MCVCVCVAHLCVCVCVGASLEQCACATVSRCSGAREGSCGFLFLTLRGERVRGKPQRAHTQPHTHATRHHSHAHVQSEEEEEEEEAVARKELFDRKSLKKKALSKERDEIRKRENEARRAAMAAKIATDLEKVREPGVMLPSSLYPSRFSWIPQKATMERLTSTQFEATGMTFLTQKPDLM